MARSFRDLSRSLKLAIICCSCVFFLAVFELAAYFFTTNDWILKTTSELSSTRWYLLWLKQVADYEMQGVTNYRIDDHHPYLGWVPKKNSRFVSEDRPTVSFNSVGIRGQKEYPFEKPPGWKRIVVVGDSFTFGEDVGDAETYSAQIEKKLKQTEVMNFAVHGYGLDQMALRFEQKALSYKPDAVVFAFIYDDMRRAALSFRDYQKPRFQLVDNQLFLSNTPIPKPEKLQQQAKFKPRTLLAFQLLSERLRFRAEQNEEVNLITRAIFERVYRQSLAQNITPVFLFLPTSYEMIDEQHGLIEGERVLFDFCQNTTAVCLSARPYLVAAYKSGARYDIDKHYEANTHTIIADGLLKDLIKHQIVQ